MVNNSRKPLRRETRWNLKSGSQIFLSIAMRNYQAFLKHDKTPDITFRYEELAINSFIYCFSAIEAHVNEIYIAQNGSLTANQFDKWQKGNLKIRLSNLFGSKVMSQRRKNILNEIIEFRNSLTHPCPIVEREIRDLLEETVHENGMVSYVADSVENEIEIAREKFTRISNTFPHGYRYTNLPQSPFELNKEQLQCCLLVLLEWAVLLSRKFKKWAGWPFYGGIGKRELQLVVDWFEQIRGEYHGALRRRFDRINTDSAKYR